MRCLAGTLSTHSMRKEASRGLVRRPPPRRGGLPVFRWPRVAPAGLKPTNEPASNEPAGEVQSELVADASLPRCALADEGDRSQQADRHHARGDADCLNRSEGLEPREKIDGELRAGMNFRAEP